LQATPTAYLTGIPGGSTQVGNTYTPYFSAAGPLIGPTTIITSDPNNPLAMAVQQTMVTQQKMPRNDRLDVSIFCGTNSKDKTVAISLKKPGGKKLGTSTARILLRAKINVPRVEFFPFWSPSRRVVVVFKWFSDYAVIVFKKKKRKTLKVAKSFRNRTSRRL